GKNLVEILAQEGIHNIIIGGRNQEKGEALREKIIAKYPHATIQFRELEANSARSLHAGMEGVDLAVITATIPDCMEAIARIAIQQKVDLMDILVREDVASQLRKYEQQVNEDGRIFITQGGFHPGMILPMMKMACSSLEAPIEANVFMAMAPVFDNAESTKEIFYEVNKTKPLLLIDGVWKKAKYTNAPSMEFSPDFGKKACYPLNMPEIYGIDQELGLKNAGTYVAGFHWFIDYVVFTLSVILGKINIKLSENVCSWMLYHFSKTLKEKLPKVEMIAIAKGKEDSNETSRIHLKSNDGYLLTAQAMYALIKQYVNGDIQKSGIYLMGRVIDENELVKDLRNMNVTIKVSS
ncbi:MAG: hypothetical protein HKN68_12355, partial [Saprospiraceae bacterium]|nr:hypothetical protein [Saprospiraceae bacterium]